MQLPYTRLLYETRGSRTKEIETIKLKFDCETSLC